MNSLNSWYLVIAAGCPVRGEAVVTGMAADLPPMANPAGMPGIAAARRL
jgi:hypothetical protein